MYIGQTIYTLDRRYHSGYGYQGCKKFQAAINKYGLDNFERWIFMIVETQVEADQEEKYWIAKMKDILGNKNIYNISDGGNAGATGMRGKKHSEETKKKMSAWQIGRKMSKEAKIKMSIAHKGKMPWNKGIINGR